MTEHWIHSTRRLRGAIPCALAGTMLLGTSVHAFDSGSTGADGAFAPAVSTELPLPANGIFNFTTIDIPAGVTLTFAKNTTNTPVVIRATGDVTIAGIIDISGGDAPAIGAAGDGVIGDDGLPGIGGPGGYDGGSGRQPEAFVPVVENDRFGGSGLGPGGGGAGFRAPLSVGSDWCYAGGGAGFGQDGTGGYSYNSGGGLTNNGGSAYGSSLLLPLIGGSGGGGGTGGTTFAGSGGGGGAGAILIAASGTVDISGSLLADGGAAGQRDGAGAGTAGGGGSGGAIRIVATTISGDGTISAQGANRFSSSSEDASCYQGGDGYGGGGGDGRIRLEAEAMLRTAATDPPATFADPGDLFVSGLPTLRIARVGGIAAPLEPTGVADIQFPVDLVNPVTVEVQATGIPLGNIVDLTLVPQLGDTRTTVTNALSGTVDLSTANALIDLPPGPSTLLASVTYTLIASVAQSFEHYAGEPVKSLRVKATMGGAPRYLLITETGREVPIGKAQLAAAGL